MTPKLKYTPGNLLHEFSYDSHKRRYNLLGLYFIVSIDAFDATVVSLYDRDGYYKPLSRIDISHEDLHKEGKLFKWGIS